MSIRAKPRRADEHIKWLQSIAKKDTSYRPEGPLTSPTIAALTGCDYRALEAIDRLWALHCYCDHPERVLLAVAYAASEMQESTRPFARELIARSKDWNDRERLWPRVEALIALIEKNAPTFYEAVKRLEIAP